MQKKTTTNNKKIARRRVIRTKRQQRIRRLPNKTRNFKTVNAPQSIATTVNYTQPKFTNENSGTVIVEHTEFLADIPGNTIAFANKFIPINAGMADSFPWLASIAQSYETYSFLELTFIYKAICPTTTGGYILFAVDYDAADPPYTSKVQAMNGPYVDSSSWKNFNIKCNHKNLHKFKQYYTRAGPITGSFDIKTYDVGNFQYAVGGQANISVIGELHVHYKVRLMTPQLSLTNTNAQFSSTAVENLIGIGFGTLLGSDASRLVQQVIQEVTMTPDSVIAESTGEFMTMFYWTGALINFTSLSLLALGGALIHSARSTGNAFTASHQSIWHAPLNLGVAAVKAGIRYLAAGTGGFNGVFGSISQFRVFAEQFFYINAMNRVAEEHGTELSYYVFNRKAIPKLMNKDGFSMFLNALKNYGLPNAMQMGRDNLLELVMLDNYAIAKRYLYYSESQGKFVECDQLIKEEKAHDDELGDLTPLMSKKVEEDVDVGEDCSRCEMNYGECVCYSHLGNDKITMYNDFTKKFE